MTTTYPITLLDHNPWQTRAIDAAHAEALAADIAANGLLQPPVARPHPTEAGRYQLALGHHRLAAFKHLATSSTAYAEMPVEVRPLTDLEMADIAIAENEKRKALSPIEKAQALRRLIDEFKLSQDEAGQRFGMTASGVSNLLRLLRLPAAIQTLTGDGLPERHARGLVALARSLPKQAEVIAQKVAAADDKDDAFAEALSDVLMRNGRGLYHTDFDQKVTYPADYASETAKAMGLTEFPACKGCEFFIARRAGGNYCARPGCFDAKTIAARWKMARSTAKALGVELLKPEENAKVIYSGAESEAAFAKAALKLKHASLRLIAAVGEINTWSSEHRARKDLLGSEYVVLGTVDLPALKAAVPADVAPKAAPKNKAEAEKQKREALAEKEKARQAKEAERQARLKASEKLIARVAQLGAPMLPEHEGLLFLLTMQLVQHGDARLKTAKTSLERRAAVMHALTLDYLSGQNLNVYCDADPAKIEAALRTLAGKLALKLPTDFGNGSNGSTPAAKTVALGVSTGKPARRALLPAPKPQPARARTAQKN